MLSNFPVYLYDEAEKLDLVKMARADGGRLIAAIETLFEGDGLFC